MPNMYDLDEPFDFFFDSCDEKATILARMSRRFPSLALPAKACRILDIGSHDGRFATMYAQTLASQGVGGTLTCIDPSKEALERFRHHAVPETFRSHLVHDTAESFLAKDHGQYDLIVASHSLYWSPDLGSLIAAFAERTKHFFIAIRGQRGTYETQKEFKDKVGAANEQLYRGTDVRGKLDQIGLAYEVEEFAATLPMPQFGTKMWLDFVGFLLQRDPASIDERLSRDVAHFLPADGNFIEDNVLLWIKGKAGAVAN